MSESEKIVEINIIKNMISKSNTLAQLVLLTLVPFEKILSTNNSSINNTNCVIINILKSSNCFNNSNVTGQKAEILNEGTSHQMQEQLLLQDTLKQRNQELELEQKKLFEIIQLQRQQHNHQHQQQCEVLRRAIRLMQDQKAQNILQVKNTQSFLQKKTGKKNIKKALEETQNFLVSNQAETFKQIKKTQSFLQIIQPTPSHQHI